MDNKTNDAKRKAEMADVGMAAFIGFCLLAGGITFLTNYAWGCIVLGSGVLALAALAYLNGSRQ